MSRQAQNVGLLYCTDHKVAQILTPSLFYHAVYLFQEERDDVVCRLRQAVFLKVQNVQQGHVQQKAGRIHANVIAIALVATAENSICMLYQLPVHWLKRCFATRVLQPGANGGFAIQGRGQIQR